MDTTETRFDTASDSNANTNAPGADDPGRAAPPPPTALADLIAAGLVTHEMIGDPAILGAEAPALDRLCALVAGAIYRIGPFHYAFRAEAADMGGALAGLPAEDWTGALEAALQAELGRDSVWLSATDLLSDALALAAEGGEAMDGPLALLRLRGATTAAALGPAPEGLRAVIDAAYASETARATAARLGAETRAAAGEITRAIARDVTREVVGEVVGGIAREAEAAAMDAARAATGIVLEAATRAAAEAVVAGVEAMAGSRDAGAGALDEIALRLAALEARLPAVPDPDPVPDFLGPPAPTVETRLTRIETALETLLARLDLGETRHDLLGEHLAEHLTLRLGDTLSGRIETGFGARAGAEADFEETARGRARGIPRADRTHDRRARARPPALIRDARHEGGPRCPGRIVPNSP